MTTLEKQTADAIYTGLNQLSDKIASLQQSKRMDISLKYGLNDSKYSEYARHDLHQLAEALTANNPQQFARYIVWQRSMLRGHQVPEFFTDLNLETEQAALTDVLPLEYHPIVIRFLQGARETLKEADKSNQSFLQDTAEHTGLAKQYLKTLLAGERGEASELISSIIDSGVSIHDIYLHVFQPCLYEVGRLWQTGQITVAHEHFFSAATQFIMSELYPRIHKHVTAIEKVAVAACVSGELHEIGLRMSADLLELDGWRTFYLGANMPALSIVEMLREKNAQLLLLSFCLPINGPVLRELILTIREQLGNTVKIIIGGYSVSADPLYAASFGADAVADDAGEAIALANRLVGR
jgi:methanogenic corrinoid protein MtbC1